MRYQSLCQTLIDLGHVPFDQVYLLQVQFQDDTLRLGQMTAQRISELLFAGMQPPVAQSPQFDRVADVPTSASNMRRPLLPRISAQPTRA